MNRPSRRFKHIYMRLTETNNSYLNNICQSGEQNYQKSANYYLLLAVKDFEIGEVIPGRYVTWSLFECYDITTPLSPTTEVGRRKLSSSIYYGARALYLGACIKDARTILYYLSKNKKVLEVIRNGQPR